MTVRNWSVPGRDIESVLEDTEYVLVDSPELEDAVARLRYDAYLQERAILPSASGSLTDKFDRLPNSATFAVFIGGCLVASIRVHAVTHFYRESPALEAFPEVADLLSPRGIRLIDPNRFVAAPGISRMGAMGAVLPLIVLRLPFMAADYLEAGFATATVRSEHQAFYARTLSYRAKIPPRPYPTLIKDLGLMLVDFRAERQGVLDRHPVFAPRRGEAERCFGRLADWLHTSRQRSEAPGELSANTTRVGGTAQLRVSF